MRPLPFFLRSIQTPLFLALLHRGTRCVPTKMSLYCHAILLKNEQKFAKIRKRLRVRKSEKGLKIKGFQGFCANEEIIVTMLPKPRRRVRFPYPAPSSRTKKDIYAKNPEVSTVSPHRYTMCHGGTVGTGKSKTQTQMHEFASCFFT